MPQLTYNALASDPLAGMVDGMDGFFHTCIASVDMVPGLFVEVDPTVTLKGRTHGARLPLGTGGPISMPLGVVVLPSEFDNNPRYLNASGNYVIPANEPFQVLYRGWIWMTSLAATVGTFPLCISHSSTVATNRGQASAGPVNAAAGAEVSGSYGLQKVYTAGSNLSLACITLSGV